MVLQGDGGHDFNCTTPRNMAATLMIIVALKLEHVMCIKNSGGNSIFNPVERVMSVLNLSLQAMACDRKASTDRVEDKIVKAKSVKKFFDDNVNNSSITNEHIQSAQSAIDELNASLEKCAFGGQNIELGKIATNDMIKECV